MTEDDLRDLEIRLIEQPKLGDVIIGTHGLRKVRVGASGKGRRGGGRVLYRDFEKFARIFFLYFIRKGDQEDLDANQRLAIARSIQNIEWELEKSFGMNYA